MLQAALKTFPNPWKYHAFSYILSNTNPWKKHTFSHFLFNVCYCCNLSKASLKKNAKIKFNPQLSFTSCGPVIFKFHSKHIL